MIFETVTLSLLLGKLKGGKIKNIGNLYIKGWYLFVISFLVEIISLWIVSKTNGEISSMIERKFVYIHIFIYLMLIIGLLVNFSEKGFRISLLGSILNFLPLSLNNGKMPVSINALKTAKLYTQLSLLDEGRIMTHGLGHEFTKFMFLGDIIPIPKPYPFPKIISIGDIFISLGLLIVILTYMDNKYDSKIKTINSYRL